MSEVLAGPNAPIVFHVMAKPTGAICNLDCEYCFFLSKEMLYPGSRFRMAEELQDTYIRQLLEGHRAASEVVMAWQGGEPTMMGLDFFRRSIEIQRKYSRPGRRILNTIQTNGVCNGGCPKDRFATSPSGESDQHHLCPGYRLFFHHVTAAMQHMTRLLQEGRAPSEVTQRYAAEDAKRGRNEPCPCGGGRKWKHCHEGTRSRSSPPLGETEDRE